MDIHEKLELLGGDARFDLDASAQIDCAGFVDVRKSAALGNSISTVLRSDGKPMPVLKTMLSSYCARNCFYCPWRRGRDLPRVQFTPEELSRAFMQMHKKRLVEGLFLSSGIHGRSAWTMDRLITVGELLRTRHEFKGYIHLKIMPGVDRASVEAAMQFADRISINLEAPNAARLEKLAPEKNLFSELLPALYWANEINVSRRARGLKTVSTTTQFVVGAAGESDRELVATSHQLVREAHLSRPYYSAFQPVAGTPLEGLPAEDPRRQHRLYQADFLMRQYRFSPDELVFDAAGNLPRHADPKRLYADHHPELYPVELNRASRETLLRVPGIGPRSAERIIQMRRQGTLKDCSELEKLGLMLRRAAPYILLAGRPAAGSCWPLHQLPLF
jgi:predicted DNA-binding helix-hairpin-helix protein